MTYGVRVKCQGGIQSALALDSDTIDFSIGLMGLAVILAYRMHQETAFPAVDFPEMSDDPSQLPLADDMMLAIIEYEGVTKAYPLDYVIHHHIINDHLRYWYATDKLSLFMMDSTNATDEHSRNTELLKDSLFASSLGNYHSHHL
jgi:hypothetical protein